MRFIVLVVTLAIVSACGSDGDAASAAAFRSPTYGYTIDRPDGWDVVEATHTLEDGEPPATAGGGTDILGRHASVDVRDITPPGVIIGGQPVAEGTTSEQWARTVIGTVSFMKGCPRPDAQENITVGGDGAVLLTYEQCPEERGFFHYWVAAVHEGVGFHIVWFDEMGRTEVDRPDLDALLSSISFDP
jgi:hypothetical protein